ncbi:MAG: imidazole glycerol phosphate synthase subunit HisH [Ruminococcaceae bacterium]|nr:imidazole glycerol phosphate synthase subunit HisH [Oscillospiraceae bacterium]
MVGIIDYGVGNLFSLGCAFQRLGEEVVVSDDPQILSKADRLVLPGVGAFADAAEKLQKTGLGDFLKTQAQAGKPVMGICLGMQLLFEKSFEYGEHPGLSLLKGSVVSMAGVIPESLKVPHMGWNKLEFTKNSRLFTHISQGDYVYFVHSYFASDCPDSVCAVSEYGEKLTAAVEKGNIYGCQFHPEKSGQVGLNILKAFCEV